ncbi:MAG TPA: phosphatase PAP2-related protein [Methylomirabilota bacterium]|nr:phosphatase PAP2-related protein [Methylomirabilota bacterium]
MPLLRAKNEPTGRETTSPTLRPFAMAKRIVALSVMLVLYALAIALGAYAFPSYHNASGVEDLGHLWVPPLLLVFGRETAQYIFWLGTLPLELFYVVITLVILCTGKGIRLGICLYVVYFLHWLFLHATTLPPPDHMVWQFPKGVFTFGKPYLNDFWFSGHTANAVLVALATAGQRPWIRALVWGNVPFQILLVLSTRTHYTIDVLGGIFVAYAIHRVSLDVAAALSRRSGQAPAMRA